MDYYLFSKLLIVLCVTTAICGTYEEKKPHKKLKKPKEIKETKKYFQDIYAAQLVPGEKEFGHVFEDPLRWEQRFEKIHLDSNRHQGKVKWGDDNGGYGEYYFDFNHGGDDEDESNEKEDADAKGEKENDEEGKRAKSDREDIDVPRQHHLADEVELLPGYKVEKSAPLHGGNYRKFEE